MNGRPAPILYNESSAVDMVAAVLGFRPLVTGDGGPRARRGDPVTAHEAADSNDTASSRRHVMRLLLISGPLADHEMVDMYELMAARHGTDQWPPFTPQRLRTARAELTEDGLVEFTGLYHLTPSNRRAKVWSVA